MRISNGVTEPAREHFKSRAEFFLAAAITLVIFYFHFYFWLHVGGLWRDEVNSINVARQNSIAAMTHDSFPLLMPLLLHGWLAFAKTDLGLRALGLLIGVATPVALWFATWKIRRATPLLGLVLFCANTTLITYGDSLRAYGFGSLLIALVAAAACFHLQRPNLPRAILFSLFAILSVQTLYQNAVLVAAICAGSFAVFIRKKNWNAATQTFFAGTFAAISLLPYLRTVVSGRASSAVLQTGVDAQTFVADATNAFGFPFEQYTYIWMLLVLAIIAQACFVIFQNQKNVSAANESDLQLFAGIVAPLAAIGLSAFLWRAALSMKFWYLLPLMAVIVVCFDLARPLAPRWRIGISIFAAVTMAISIPVLRSDLKYRFTNMDVRLQQMKTHVAHGDYVIVAPWFCGISFEHYFTDDAQWTTLPPLTDHSTHRYDLVQIQLQNTNAIAPVFEQISRTLQSSNQVFILAAHGWMEIPERNTPAMSSLPPAPTKNFGWSEMPYTQVWASQVAHFLADHSREFARVKSPTEGMRIAEDMELFVASGWENPGQTNSSSNPAR